MKAVALKLLGLVPAGLRDHILRQRALVVFGLQVGLIIAANLVAFSLRFDGEIPAFYWTLALKALPMVALIYWGGLVAFGIQKGLWRYVGLHDLARILWASVSSTVFLYIFLHWVLQWTHYPRSVIILTGLLTAGFLGGIRLAVRSFREWLQVLAPTACRVLIVGAGNAGELLVRDMLTDPKYNYRPVGFVDDDPVKQRAKIHGVGVLGTIHDIPRVVDRYQPHEMIVAIPSGTPEVQQKILAAAEACRIPIKTLPSLRQMLSAPVSMRRVRPMSLEDLLQREPVRTDLQELRPFLEGRRILVTGAGGSIGSELCRQISDYQPASLILFERHENSLYSIELELREAFPSLALVPVIGDITVSERVGEVFETQRPHVIFHAAAHKHVPLMEENPHEAVRNNVFGTRTLCDIALQTQVEQFVLISTDKAVNPMSVMGTTKRIAEYVVQDMNRRGGTRFTTVRFGNVLGSTGSVVPLFTEQIQKGGPVTVTHPDVRRYFMTIPEAVQLVLQASVMGRGGDTFVLEMGDPIRIADLARNLIVLSGRVPDLDIKVVFTGLRPGEKLNEELFVQGEEVEPTPHAKIKRTGSCSRMTDQELTHHLRELQAMLNGHDKQEIARRLREIVSEEPPLVGEHRS